jgi:hypothetical protein
LESVAFRDQPVVGQERRACRRSGNERRAIAAHQAEAVFVLISVDMLNDLRAALWKEGDWSFDEVERKAIWLASCLSFNGDCASATSLAQVRNRQWTTTFRRGMPLSQLARERSSE